MWKVYHDDLRIIALSLSPAFATRFLRPDHFAKLAFNKVNFHNFVINFASGEKMTKSLKLLAVIFAASIIAMACTQTKTPETGGPANTNSSANAEPKTSATPVEMASGKNIFVDNCAKCHKEDGTGGKVEIEGKILKPDNLTTEKMKKEPDEEYFEYIEDGIPDEGMPAFKDILKEKEIKEVVKYIREELQK